MEKSISSPRLVRDLMTVGVPTCPPDTNLVDLVRRMLEKDWESVIVLNPDDGHAIGVVSQDEVVRVYGHDRKSDMKAEDVMRADITQIPPDIPLEAAAQLMQDLHVRTVFLMHHAGGVIYPAAFLSYKHLMRHLAARDEDELRDLGISADRELPLDAFKKRVEEAKKRSRPSGRL